MQPQHVSFADHGFPAVDFTWLLSLLPALLLTHLNFQEAATEIRSSSLLQTCESVEMMNSHTATIVKGLLKSNLNGFISSPSPSGFCFDGKKTTKPHERLFPSCPLPPASTR